MSLDNLEGLGFGFAFFGLTVAVIVALPAVTFSRAAFRWALSRQARRQDLSGPRWVSLLVLWISGVPAVYVAGLFFGLGFQARTLAVLAVALLIAVSNLVHAAYCAECISRVRRDRVLVEPSFKATLRSRSIARAALVFLVFAFIEGALLVVGR